MKTKTVLCLCLPLLYMVLAGCSNPWMDKILDPFFSGLTVEQRIDMADFGTTNNIYRVSLSDFPITALGNYVVNVSGIQDPSSSSYVVPPGVAVSLHDQGGADISSIDGGPGVPPIFHVLSNGKLIVRGSKFTIDAGSSRPAIENDGTLVIHSVTIEKLPGIGTSYGIINNGTFAMTGGSIADCTEGVLNTGTFAMTGGSIADCTMGVDNNGTFTMTGGSITANSDGVYHVGGIFTMTEGKITDNTNNGVVVAAGVFKMSGGTIARNFSSGVLINGIAGSFTMTGGYIRNNNPGSGVSVNSGNFYLNVASKTSHIYGNSSGNVQVSGGGAFWENGVTGTSW